MYVLDTNILSYYFGQPQNYPNLVQRIRDADSHQLLSITIINAQEIAGHLANKIPDRPDVPRQRILQLYGDMTKVMMFLRGIPILAFDEAAYEKFVATSELQTAIGTRDRRIAAITLANDATLITRDRGFDLVPNLKVADWVTG